MLYIFFGEQSSGGFAIKTREWKNWGSNSQSKALSSYKFKICCVLTFMEKQWQAYFLQNVRQTISYRIRNGVRTDFLGPAGAESPCKFHTFRLGSIFGLYCFWFHGPHCKRENLGFPFFLQLHMSCLSFIHMMDYKHESVGGEKITDLYTKVKWTPQFVAILYHLERCQSTFYINWELLLDDFVSIVSYISILLLQQLGDSLFRSLWARTSQPFASQDVCCRWQSHDLHFVNGAKSRMFLHTKINIFVVVNYWTHREAKITT